MRHSLPWAVQAQPVPRLVEPNSFRYLRCNSADLRFSASGEITPAFFSSSVASRSTNGVRT